MSARSISVTEDRSRGAMLRPAPSNWPLGQRLLTGSPSVSTADWLAAGNVRLNLASREISVGASTLALPRKEARLLEAFMRHFGGIVTRATLYGHIADQTPFHCVAELTVRLRRLRRQLAAAGADIDILPVQGIGYSLRSIDGDD